MNDILKRKSGRKPSRTRAHRPVLFRSEVEPLDQRLALTGLSVAVAGSISSPAVPLQISAVVPTQNTLIAANSATAASFCPAFAVHFNEAVDFSHLTGRDFQVEQVAADGSTTMLSPFATPLSEVPDLADKSASTLVASFLSPLDPGRYRLILAGGAGFVGSDGQTAGSDSRVIEEFAVGRDATISTASQTIGSISTASTMVTVPVVTSDLDAKLNEIDLPPGTDWSITPQFGAADPESFRFALFDAQKELILSLPGSDLDLLNRNLVAGTSYLQIYQTKPTPNGLSNSLAINVTGKPADPDSSRVVAVTPTNFTGLDSDADSLVAQFDGSGIPRAFLNSSQYVFSLSGANGQSVPLVPLAADMASNRLVLGFTSGLPAGHYALQVAPTDNTGVIRQLGSFDNSVQPRSADDLGTIFVGPSGGTSSLPMIQPGGSTTLTFAVIEAHEYRLALANSDLTGSLIRSSNASVSGKFSQPVGDQLNRSYYLEPGIYQVVITNPSKDPASSVLTVASVDTSFEALSTGGVGQMPANIRATNLVIGLSGVGMDQATVTGGLATLSEPTSGNVERGGASRASVPTNMSPFESSGSFNASSFNQVPLGSLLPAGPKTPANPPSAAGLANPATLAAAHAAIFLSPAVPSIDPRFASLDGRSPEGFDAAAGWRSPVIPGIPSSIRAETGVPAVLNVSADAEAAVELSPNPSFQPTSSHESPPDAQIGSTGLDWAGPNVADSADGAEVLDATPAWARTVSLIGLLVTSFLIYRRFGGAKATAAAIGRALASRCLHRGVTRPRGQAI